MIKRVGNTIQGSLIVSFVVPFCFMLFFRVGMNRIWALYYMLQLLVNIKNFKQLLTPANAQLVVDMTDNVVNFKLL